MNRDEEYNRLHDHCQALGRERDGTTARVRQMAWVSNNDEPL
jgi:hypothetical protein